MLLVMAPHRASANQIPQQIAGDGTLRRLSVPILMYHYVSSLPADADPIRTGLTVTPSVFAEQLQYLSDQSYETISLYEIDEALLYGSELPLRPIILTFDDGHIDHYSNVFPLLQSHNFTATFFIITDFADNAAPGYMNWNQIKQLADNGMIIEPHTKSHVDLRNRDYDFLVYQIIGSLESVRAHTSTNPRAFAYPAGAYDATTLQFLDTTSITRAVTTQPGILHTTDNRFQVKRLRITQDMSAQGFASLLGTNQ
jgi:peptidoglycan/xylan/chitin deacetylase (PgdA/CDA1 family)